MKDFFKSFEVLCRSEKGQRGSKGEILFVLSSLRKKVLRTLSDFAVFLNIVEDSFKSFEVLSRSGKIKISSKGERIFVLEGLRKKYLAQCQILRSKYYLYTIQQKVFFNIVKESFQSFDVLRRSTKIKIGSKGE